MLFRRLSQHVKDQNWTAVLIDFVIVVSGVLIGLQAQGWVEARQDRADYHLALDRLESELSEILATAEEIDAGLSERLVMVTDGINALQSCDDTPGVKLKIDRAITLTRGTYGLKIRSQAIREITESPILLAQQSAKSRAQFSELRARLEYLQREANFIEELPLRDPVENNPIIKIGEPKIQVRTINELEWESVRRDLSLAVPVSQACQDNDLIKRLYYWERWQAEMLAITKILEDELPGYIDHIRSQR